MTGFNKEKDRENVEWSNTWIDNAKNFGCPRILLVGASGAREFRSSLGKLLPKYAVDFVGSSASIEDHLLYDVCDMFFKNKEYSYSLILVNIGGKHGMYLHTADNAEDAEQYERAYQKFLGYLYSHTPNIVILTTAPNVRANNLKKFDDDVNREICSRNKIQTQVSETLAFQTIDLYSHAVQKKFKYRDTQHFAGKKYQLALADYIINSLSASQLITNIRPHYRKKWQGFFAAELAEHNKLKIKWGYGLCKVVRVNGVTKYYLADFCIKTKVRKSNHG